VTRWWCEWAWSPGGPLRSALLLEVADGRITRADAGAEPGRATVLRGLTLPGFVNAHSHAFHRLLRGRTQAGRGSFWTWRTRMYELAAVLDPELMRDLATAVYAEMAQAGITTVGEFHYIHRDPDGHRYAEPNAMGAAIINAASAAGLRLTLIDTCYLSAGPGLPLAPEQRRFGDGDADAWATRADELSDTATMRVAGAVHSARAVAPDQMKVVAEWAARRGAPLHAHVSEQPRENEECLAAYGRAPVQLLDRAGLLQARFTAVHATHLTGGDIETLGRAGAVCCFCPTTERDLADGVGPAQALTAAGCQLALGTDSGAVIDFFEEARAVELNERLVSGIRGQHSAAELLAAATAGGARSLGWDECGRLTPGGLADFVTVSMDSVRLAGSEPEYLLESVAFAASAGDVTSVVVGGRRVVADGRHLLVPDPARAITAAARRARERTAAR
jgi:formiminoglutamate deiminase